MGDYSYKYLDKQNIFLQNIFFVASGTSNVEVLKSLGISSKSFSEDNGLLDIGIKQMHMLSSNQGLKKILLNSDSTSNKYYSLLSVPCIESGLVYAASSSDNIKIYPLPFSPSKPRITSKNYIKIKKKIKNDNNNINNANEKTYWMKKNIKSSNYYEILLKVPRTNWGYTDGIEYVYEVSGYNRNIPIYKKKQLSELKGKIGSTYFPECLKLLETLIKNNIEDNKYFDIPGELYSSDNFKYHRKIYKTLASGEKAHLLKNIVFFVSGNEIDEIISKKFSSFKKDIKLSRIENSSVWKLSIVIKREINSRNLLEYIFKYDDFDKIYPTESTHSPLSISKIDYIYKFRYNNVVYPLFDSISPKPIHLKYLRKMDFSLLSYSELKNINTKVKSEHNLNDNNNKNNISVITHKKSFNSLLKENK
jgi:hypothetical protein